jgi:CO dehydrogenase nickel-insertion accessory protein CooC1
MKIKIEGEQGEGKSWVARQIAMAMLSKGYHVVLEDGADGLSLGSQNKKSMSIVVVQNGEKDA